MPLMKPSMPMSDLLTLRAKLHGLVCRSDCEPAGHAAAASDPAVPQERGLRKAVHRLGLDMRWQEAKLQKRAGSLC